MSRTLFIKTRAPETPPRAAGPAIATLGSMTLWAKKSHIASVALGPRGSVYEPALAPPDQACARPETSQYWLTFRTSRTGFLGNYRCRV